MKVKFLHLFVALTVCYVVGYISGNKKGTENTTARYEKQLSQYSVVFTPTDAKLVKNSQVRNLKEKMK